MDIQQLIELDKEVLLALNGCHSLFWDGFMWQATKTITWIPVAIALLYVLFKNNKPQQAAVILVAIALCITFSDQITSGLCKPFFARLRPTQDPEIMYLVHTVNGYRGGLYGFTLLTSWDKPFSTCIATIPKTSRGKPYIFQDLST